MVSGEDNRETPTHTNWAAIRMQCTYGGILPSKTAWYV